MSDSELVRVRTETGYETTTTRVHAEASSDLTILDEPGDVQYGRVRPVTRVDGRPVKAKTSVADKVSEKKAAANRSAATEAVTASAKNEGNSK